MIKFLIRITLILALSSEYVFASDPCHPEISVKDDNYLIGYGSLMQKQSRRTTHPNARYVYPIEVKGFKRLWAIQGGNYKTTFLTLIKSDKSFLNAVYYSVADYDILEADEREIGYCRILVSNDDIQPLGLKDIPDGKYWVYAQKDDKIDLPNHKYPIVQSYVDIFLDGCIQIGKTYRIPDFLNRCIHETYGWPTENNTWVNDRQFPRRPFRTPNAFNIDKILSKEFKNYYEHPID